MYGLALEEWQSLVLSLNTHRNKRRLSPYDVALLIEKAVQTSPVDELAGALGFADSSTIRRISKLAILPRSLGNLVGWGNGAGYISMSVASELMRLDSEKMTQSAVKAALQYSMSKSEARQLAQIVKRGEKNLEAAIELVLKTRPKVERQELIVGGITSEAALSSVLARGEDASAKKLKLDLAKLCPEIFPKSVTISTNTFSIMLNDGDTVKLHKCLSGGSIEERITALLEVDSESI